MEEGSRTWYRVVLVLPDEGGVPGLPVGGVKASKADCVAAFGPQTSAGRYTFWGRGSVEYEAYTSKLLERTQQEVVNDVNSLPYQFARGLLDEESGLPVNWIVYALRRQRRHGCWKTTSQYVLPKYRGMEVPIPFVHPRVPVGERLPPSEVYNTPVSTSREASDITSAGIPMPVRRGMKLLLPSIQRLCNLVMAALEEENEATVHAADDLDATRLGMLKKCRASYTEELEHLKNALSLQQDVFNAMFECGEQAVGARKRAKTELKEALQTDQKPKVIDNLTASKRKCYQHIM